MPAKICPAPRCEGDTSSLDKSLSEEHFKVQSPDAEYNEGACCRMWSHSQKSTCARISRQLHRKRVSLSSDVRATPDGKCSENVFLK